MLKTNRLLQKVSAFVIAAAAVFTLAAPAQAAYTIGDDETYLKIGGLLQFHTAFNQDAAPNGKGWETEFYLRRMRLMFFGQLNKYVNFFVETDNPRFGLRGDFTGDTFIQDAYVEFNLHPAIQIDMGMLLIPFSHHGSQGATSLLTIDYHRAIAYPAGSNKVWRDYGIMLRGMPIGKWLEYRIGVFNGVRGTGAPIAPVAPETAWTGGNGQNESDIPRFTVRLVGNIFEPEGGAGVGGMFADGLYLKETEEGIISTKRVLSIGASFDMQPDVVVNAQADGTIDTSPYFAAAGDVFWDIPLGGTGIMSLNGQVNVYYYNHGDPTDGALLSGGVTGLGIASELGFRWNFIQPLVAMDMFVPTANPTNVDAGAYMGIYGGVNYWVFAHAFNIKAQFGAADMNGADDWKMAALLQAQLVF